MNWTDLTGHRPGLSAPSLHQRLTLGSLELLCLGSSADTTCESSEGDDLFVVLDIGEVGVRLFQVHAYKISDVSNMIVPTIESGSDFTHVLEVSSHILASSPGD